MSTPAAPSATPPAAGGNGRLLFVLIFVSGINPVGVNMFVPAMPDMIKSLSTDLASIQFVLSAYLFATAVAQLVLGPLSDRLGRRPVLIGGLIVFALSSVACAVAPSVGLLIIARVAQGIGGCAGIVLSRAIVRDRYERDRAAAALGYVTMGFAIAPMVSPTIGGLLNDHFGWRAIFALHAILGAVALLLAIFILPETRRPLEEGAARPRFVTSFVALARLPAFWAFALTLCFGVSVFFSFLGGTPVIASELLSMSGTEFGLYFAFAPAGFMLGNFLTARYSNRFGITAMMICGTGLAVFGVLCMGAAFLAGWYHPLSLFLPMYALGLANGLTFSNALAGAVSLRPQYAGAASGLAGSLQVGGGAIASVLIGVLLSSFHSVFTLVGCMLAFAIASLAAAIWSRTAKS